MIAWMVLALLVIANILLDELEVGAIQFVNSNVEDEYETELHLVDEDA